jgi:hypothetical protein
LFARNSRFGLHWRGDQVFHKRKESDVNRTTVAVDFANSVFKMAVADEHWRGVSLKPTDSPARVDADNASGSLPAARSDWRFGHADSMS